MRRKNRPSLRFEPLDSRITPYTSRAIGTFQITDTTVAREWTATGTGASTLGDVVGTDILQASLDVTYTLTGKALQQATNPAGLTLANEEIRWYEEDSSLSEVCSRVRFSVNITAPPGTVGSYSKTVDIRFPASFSNDTYSIPDYWTDAEYYGWFDLWGPVNYRTPNIVLDSAATSGGGVAPGAALRANSTNVTVTALAALNSPDLPILAASQGYKVFTFDSADGENFTLRAANTTGYGLFAASSSALVEDPDAPDGDTILDPTTTLAQVYPNGSPYAGAYGGSNKDLVVRSSNGTETLVLSGYAYSEVPTGLLSLADGQTMSFAGDDIAAGDDALWLNYETATGTVGFIIAAATLTTPTLSISDATETEGNSGTTNATFTVTLSEASSSTVTVAYSTSAGTASSSSDFTSTSGTLTFDPYETSKTITVPISGDTTYELGEDFFVNLGSPTNASIADGVGSGQITNDDNQPNIYMNAPSAVSEGNSGTTIFTFTVTLSSASGMAVTVDFTTANAWFSSATAGIDYQATSGTLTFLPGETSKTIEVIIYGDTEVEEDEGFLMTLGNAIGADAGMGVSWVAIINDD